MWKQGAIGIIGANGKKTCITFWAKVYEEGSEFGINGGKISKLMLKQNEEIVYNYDRGEDIPPQTPEAEKALAVILFEHN